MMMVTAKGPFFIVDRAASQPLVPKLGKPINWMK